MSALIVRANAIAGLHDVETAIKEIREAIQLDPGPERDCTQISASLEAGPPGESRRQKQPFKQAVDVAPTSAKAHAALGNFYWSNRRSVDAERAFLKAVELEPNDLLSHRILAIFYSLSGRPLDATKP